MLVQIRPGTDGALALGLAHLLIARGAVDAAFVRAHVFGYREFVEMVREYDPDRVSDITDVPVTAIERLADWIATIAPLSICAGFGMQRYTNSAQTMRSLIALLALTGNIGKPGAGWI